MSTYVSPTSQLLKQFTFGDDDRAPQLEHQKGEGFSKGYDDPRDFDELPFCGVEGAEPFSLPMLTEREVKERIEERERTGNTLRKKLDYAGHLVKYQDGVGYCWGFCATAGVEARIIAQGAPYVSLSPASVCTQVVGHVNRGGWPSKWLAKAKEIGVARSEHWGDYDYKSKLEDKSEVLADRKLYVPTEFIDFDVRSDKEEAWWQAICCVVCDIPVAIGQMHWSHAILLADAFIHSNGEIGNDILNSWKNTWGDKGWGRQVGRKKYFEEGVGIYVVKTLAI